MSEDNSEERKEERNFLFLLRSKLNDRFYIKALILIPIIWGSGFFYVHNIEVRKSFGYRAIVYKKKRLGH